MFMSGIEILLENDALQMPVEDSEAWVLISCYGQKMADVNVARLHFPSKNVETWVVRERLTLNKSIKIRYGEIEVATSPVDVHNSDNVVARPSRLERFLSFEKMLKEEGILNFED